MRKDCSCRKPEAPECFYRSELEDGSLVCYNSAVDADGTLPSPGKHGCPDDRDPGDRYVPPRTSPA